MTRYVIDTNIHLLFYFVALLFYVSTQIGDIFINGTTYKYRHEKVLFRTFIHPL